MLRKSLQKVFAKTLGDRDYGIFEVVHIGLRLPLVFPLAETVTLNTSGARVGDLVHTRKASHRGKFHFTSNSSHTHNGDALSGTLGLWDSGTVCVCVVHARARALGLVGSHVPPGRGAPCMQL